VKARYVLVVSARVHNGTGRKALLSRDRLI
jgi:hypothetical protein